MFMQNTLILSLGGSLEPIRKSLDFHRPSQVVIFASESSAGQIADLSENLPEIFCVFKTADPNDIETCFTVASACLQKTRSLEPGTIIVDFTGGTKTMSAALVLACANQDVLLSYVGGIQRHKEGLGSVTDGSESVICRAMRRLKGVA